MGRCTICGKITLGVRKAAARLCRDCQDRLAVDVDRRGKQIRDAIVTIRYGASHSEETYEVLRRHLSVLLSYEKKGIVTILPPPSEMLRQIQPLQRTAKSSPRSSPDAAALSAGETGAQPAESESPGLSESGRRERRNGPRRKLQCMAMIQPGGLRAIARDVSPGGVYVHSPATRPKGSRLRITLYTSKGPFEVTGVVRRADRNPNRAVYTGGDGLAVEFTLAPPDLSLLFQGDS